MVSLSVSVQELERKENVLVICHQVRYAWEYA